MGFIATAILTVIVGWQGMNTSKTMGNAANRLYHGGVESIRATGQITQNFGNMRQRVRDVIIMANNPDAQRANKREYDDNHEAVNKHFAELREIVKENKENQDVALLVSKAEGTFGNWVLLVDQAVYFAMNGRIQDAIQQMTVVAAPINRKFLGELDEMAAAMDSAAEKLKEYNASVKRRADTMTIIITLVVIAASILLGVSISNMIVGTLDRISVIIQKVAHGDLTAHFIAESKDELGVMAVRLGKMVDQIWEFINKANQGIDVVASYAAALSTSAEEMSSKIEQISHSADVQRSEFDRMAAVMAVLSSSIDEVSEGAQFSFIQLETSLNAAQRGGPADEAAAGAMEDVTRTLGKIAVAIGVIREFARQANLLSFNATFGVAKADEQGKGFAAVVEEARGLTERSALSAMEIVRHNIEVRDSAQRGGEMAATTVELLQNIKTSLEQFAVQARESVAAMSERVSAGTSAAGTADGSASGVAHTATELAHLASDLQTQIRQFKLTNDEKD